MYISKMIVLFLAFSNVIIYNNGNNFIVKCKLFTVILKFK